MKKVTLFLDSVANTIFQNDLNNIFHLSWSSLMMLGNSLHWEVSSLSLQLASGFPFDYSSSDTMCLLGEFIKGSEFSPGYLVCLFLKLSHHVLRKPKYIEAQPLPSVPAELPVNSLPDVWMNHFGCGSYFGLVFLLLLASWLSALLTHFLQKVLSVGSAQAYVPQTLLLVSVFLCTQSLDQRFFPKEYRKTKVYRVSHLSLCLTSLKAEKKLKRNYIGATLVWATILQRTSTT